MAYDSSKDQTLETWENEETGLMISINRYGEGDPKLQIGPRVYVKKDGTKSNVKAGRLTIDDVNWLEETIEEIKEKMNQFYLEGE